MNTSILVSSLNFVVDNFETIISLSTWINIHMTNKRLTKQKIESFYKRPIQINEVIKFVDDINILSYYKDIYDDCSGDILRYIVSKGVYDDIDIEDLLNITCSYKPSLETKKILTLYYFTREVSYKEDEMDILLKRYCNGYDFDELEYLINNIYYRHDFDNLSEILKIPKNSFKGLRKACLNCDYYIAELLLSMRKYRKSKLIRFLDQLESQGNYRAILLIGRTQDIKIDSFWHS